MKNWRTVFLALGVLLVIPLAVMAHHGAAAYDTSNVISVKGTVTEYKFINPHVEISIAVKNDKGKVETWISEANSPNVLSRRGWSRDTMKPGDEITLIGNKGKKRFAHFASAKGRIVHRTRTRSEFDHGRTKILTEAKLGAICCCRFE